ncbi:acylneuraminate cytidylyltransferase family protein [Acinetobacter baumannii]|uniref:AciA n=1 Tax=Acinetobacter baumannii TaxID=470 RepID=A0A222UQW4_ACIBA|nr:acylneuraminate cytidylyltransferase family protein [Acinetobacter baumannii]ASR24078.1 AciA [Acinetobacter baumannii]MDW5369287.1 acylneuraminate cytidylyltransferase family protein [Acinetobacter baumannii]MDW5384497.1 acylneuraminate cytidylyltransferase family protein [Acinetobacter baumannii]MDW5412975.1 acylneuraminate cytidylyltransferase family protein [Acinetobacter baumannii]MDW5456063.1 acylneuraminate cytidylyltransferase family protein [Acinetobacter baumannii]
MIDNKRVIAVIPARAGSKSIKDKNIKLLGGKPLIAWPIDTAKKSKYIDRILVSTDGQKIKDIAESYNAEVYLRPEYLAQDNSLLIDTLRYLIKELKKEGESAQYLVVLEPTCPLRSVEDVDNVIEKLIENDSAATFIEAELNPHRAWKLEGNQVCTFIDGAIPWLPRQQLPLAYQLNGAVYGFEINKLPDTGISIIFGNIAAVIMPAERSIDIDNELHFEIAEELIKGKL